MVRARTVIDVCTFKFDNEKQNKYYNLIIHPRQQARAIK